MARLIFIAVLLTFLSVIQLVSSQGDSQACQNATVALRIATQCRQTGSDVDTSVLCNGECRSLSEAFFAACVDDEVTQQTRDAYNAVCGGAAPAKGLGIFSLLLVTLAAAVIF